LIHGNSRSFAEFTLERSEGLRMTRNKASEVSESLNSLDDALAVGLGACRLDFFCRRGLDQKPISGHAVSGLGQTYRSK
jgi:hypothetical protein